MLTRALDFKDYRWILWNTATRAMIASGNSACIPQPWPEPCKVAGATLAGGVMAMQQASSIELRSAVDGSALASIAITGSPSWDLAVDGSYIWIATATDLKAWSSSGQLLVSRPGNYAGAAIFGAPGELRVALGPAGADVIELVSSASGATVVSPQFLGGFHSWFLDGAHFFTSVSTTFRLYTKAASQVQIVSLPGPGVTGQGGYFWRTNGLGIDVYAIGGNSPVASYNIAGAVQARGYLIARVGDDGSVDVIDLSGSSPAKSSFSMPMQYLDRFSADSSGNWAISNAHGTVYDKVNFSSAAGPLPLSCGRPWSIAGSDNGRAAIATAGGGIVHFNVQPSANALEGVISFESSKVELSSDGAVLAAVANLNDSQFHPDRSLKLFAMPTGVTTKTFPHDWADYPQLFFDFTLARKAPRVGHVTGISPAWTIRRAVTDLTGSTTFFTTDTASVANPSQLPIRLAPAGERVAVSDKPPGQGGATNIYQGGILVGAAPGYAAGWLDDSNLLVATYSGSTFAGMQIRDTNGAFVASPALPEVLEFVTVPNGRIYVPAKHQIFSVATGAAVWSGTPTTSVVGGVAGSKVVYAVGSRVYADPY